jgi:hypothetical protein
MAASVRASAVSWPERKYLTIGKFPKPERGRSLEPAGTEPQTTAIAMAAVPRRPSVANTADSARCDAVERYRDDLFFIGSVECFFAFILHSLVRDGSLSTIHENPRQLCDERLYKGDKLLAIVDNSWDRQSGN